MTYDKICAALGARPETLLVFDTVVSTNTVLKELARQGAPHGAVVVADHQTGGRGRLGRSFSSPRGLGLYLSALWRVDAPPDRLMHLTCMAAEATRRAVLEASGVNARLKWINDLVIGGKKLAGILTELVSTSEGLAVICGIGINCGQTDADFPPEVAKLAVSLKQLGADPDRSALAASLIRQLELAYHDLLTPEAWMAQYRRHCLTLGQDVQLLRNGSFQPAHVDGMTQEGALLVTHPDGTHETVFSGEVSVRGLYGYLDDAPSPF